MQDKIYQILEDEAAKLGIQDVRKVNNMIRIAANVYEDDPEFANALFHRFKKHEQIRSTPFTLPPKNKLKAPIEIGTDIRGNPVGISKDETGHSLLTGRTQVGKSTTMARIGYEVNKTYQDVAMIFVDPKKSQRGLIRHIPNLYPIRLDDLKFNPLSASFENKRTQKLWISQAWSIIAREGDLLTGSKEFGLKVIKELLDEFRNKGFPPTIFDLLSKVKEKAISIPRSSPEFKYAERFSSRIEGLLFSWEETFDCRRGFPIQEFLNPKRHILLETDGIPENHALTLILLLLNSIFHYNMTHGLRGSGVKLMVFIDEAESFIGYDSKYDKSKKGSSFSNLLLERGKELGFALIMSIHQTAVSEFAFGNLNMRVSMDLSSSNDVSKIASDMGLNEDQAEILEKLEVGQAVMKVKGKWDEPFLVKINPIELENVSDQEVRQHSRVFLREMEEHVVPREKKTKEKVSGEEKTEKMVTKQEHVLLENIAKFPYLSITSRQKKVLGWSSSKLSKIRKGLRSRGLIRKVRAIKPDGGRGSSLTLLELTGKALKYLKEEGIKAKYIGRGGAAHSYYMQWFLDNLKTMGVDVSYETELGGVSVDLYIIKQSGETQAIEVEVSSKIQTLQKIRSKGLLDKVDRCLIACDKKVLVDEFKQEIEEMNIDQDRVRVRKIQDIEF